MRLDDLQFNGLKLLQNPDGFCFGSDAVELANFLPAAGRGKRLCDLGSGSGILTVLLSAKKGYRVTAVEIQAAAAELCRQNIELNRLTESVEVVQIAMQDFCTSQNKGAFDAVVCNPPYEPKGSGDTSLTEAVRIARSEEKVTLAEAIRCAAHLVKFGGKFYIVHKASRLSECMHLCTQSLLEPKVLQALTPIKGAHPHIFLLSCTKNGKPGLRILPERTVQAQV